MTPPATEPYDLHFTLCQALYQSFFAPRFAANIGHYSIKTGNPREIFFSFINAPRFAATIGTLLNKDGKPQGEFSRKSSCQNPPS